MKFSINDPNQDCIVFYGDDNKQSPVLKVSQIQQFKTKIGDSKINKIRLISIGNDSVIMTNCFQGLEWEDIEAIKFSNGIVSAMEATNPPVMSFVESFNITNFDPTSKRIDSNSFYNPETIKTRLKDSDKIMNLFGANVSSWIIKGNVIDIYNTDDLSWVLNNLATGSNNNLFRMLLVVWINFIDEQVKIIKQDFWEEFTNQNKKIKTETSLTSHINVANSFVVTKTTQLITNIVNTYNNLVDLGILNDDATVFNVIGAELRKKYETNFHGIINSLVKTNNENTKNAFFKLKGTILSYPNSLSCFKITEISTPSPTNLTDTAYKNFCVNIFNRLSEVEKITKEFENLFAYQTDNKFDNIRFKTYYFQGRQKISTFNSLNSIVFNSASAAQNILNYIEKKDTNTNLIYYRYNIEEGDDLYTQYGYESLYNKAIAKAENDIDNPTINLKNQIKAKSLSAYYNNFQDYVNEISRLSTEIGYKGDLSTPDIKKIFNTEELFTEIFQNSFKNEFDSFYCLLEIEEDFQKFLDGNYGFEKNNLLIKPKIYDILLSIKKYKNINEIDKVINFYNHVNFIIKYPNVDDGSDVTINIFSGSTTNLFSESSEYGNLFNFVYNNASKLTNIDDLIKTYINYEIQLFYNADDDFSIRYFLPITNAERIQAIKSYIFNKFSLRSKYDKYISKFNRKFILDKDYWSNAINPDDTIQVMLQSILEKRNKIDYEELNLDSYNNLEGKSLQDLFEIQNKIKTYLANWNAGESTDKTTIEFDTNINPSRYLTIQIQTTGILDLLNRIEQQRYIESNKILTDQETLDKINQEVDKIKTAIGNIATTGPYDDYIESFENALNVLQSSYYLKEKNPNNKYNLSKTYDQYLKEIEDKITNYFDNYYPNAAVKTLYNKILAKGYGDTQTDLDTLNKDKNDFDGEYNRLMGLNTRYPNAGKYATIYMNSIDSATLNSTYIEIYNRIKNALHEEELNDLEKQLEEERNKNNATENGEG